MFGIYIHQYILKKKYKYGFIGIQIMSMSVPSLIDHNKS